MQIVSLISFTNYKHCLGIERFTSLASQTPNSSTTCQKPSRHLISPFRCRLLHNCRSLTPSQGTTRSRTSYRRIWRSLVAECTNTCYSHCCRERQDSLPHLASLWTLSSCRSKRQSCLAILAFRRRLGSAFQRRHQVLF